MSSADTEFLVLALYWLSSVEIFFSEEQIREQSIKKRELW